MLCKWFWVQQLHAYVCVPAKNGGTAFYRHVFNVPNIVASNDVFGWVCTRASAVRHTPQAMYSNDLIEPSRKILAVRDPIDRFASLWRSKCRDGDKNMPFMRGWSPLDLASEIEKAPFGNEHWVPQSAYLLPGVEIVHFAILGEIIGYGRIKEENRTRPCSAVMPAHRIHDLYRADFELFSRC